jgi:hypothetical protein
MGAVLRLRRHRGTIVDRGEPNRYTRCGAHALHRKPEGLRRKADTVGVWDLARLNWPGNQVETEAIAGGPGWPEVLGTVEEQAATLGDSLDFRHRAFNALIPEDQHRSQHHPPILQELPLLLHESTPRLAYPVAETDAFASSYLVALAKYLARAIRRKQRLQFEIRCHQQERRRFVHNTGSRQS